MPQSVLFTDSAAPKVLIFWNGLLTFDDHVHFICSAIVVQSLDMGNLSSSLEIIRVRPARSALASSPSLVESGVVVIDTAIQDALKAQAKTVKGKLIWISVSELEVGQTRHTRRTSEVWKKFAARGAKFFHRHTAGEARTTSSWKRRVAGCS